MIPTAFLRVYQPLDAFERDEQRHWERYLLDRLPAPLPRQRYHDLPGEGGLGLLTPALEEHADVLVHEGRTYVSPRRIRMRVLASILTFNEEKPLELWDQYLAKGVVKKARRDLKRLRRRDPSAITFVQQSSWHVPIRWFAFFDDDERWIGEDGFGRTRLRYRTPIRKAIRRAGDAIPVLRRSELGPIGELILDLHQWLVLFDRHSIVELDYGSLCDFLTWDELDNDRSVRDVREALEALHVNEFPRSAQIYQGVIGRWAEVRSREILN